MLTNNYIMVAAMRRNKNRNKEAELPLAEWERTLLASHANSGTAIPVDEVTVCLVHKRFVPCRSKTGCKLSTRPADVEKVRKWQQST